MRSDFIELARICISHSHVTASLEVAAELRRIAKNKEKRQGIRVRELALLMVKKMWEMFCKRGKDGPRQHVTKDGSIMDNRPSVSSFTSRYNHFLFAPICEEANGMRLSVLSALARMDVDPWEEATRLAAMPKAIAERTLVSTLDQVLGKSCHRSETEVIAARLVQRLPQRGEDATVAQTETARVGTQRTYWLVWLGFALAISLLSPRHQVTDAGGAPSNQARHLN